MRDACACKGEVAEDWGREEIKSARGVAPEKDGKGEVEKHPQYGFLVLRVLEHWGASLYAYVLEEWRWVEYLQVGLRCRHCDVEY